MPRRFKDRNKSIFVKFYDDVGDEEVGELLSSLGVAGIRVSNLINRWAVEIPFWKEGFFVEKFDAEVELVEKVHESFDRKRTNYEMEDEGNGE
ncbi:MAG: hypothetical protein EBU90_28555 [Proteobacteria bacterium]|nr:hypothetical protein [Pseudomonadota bacterium]